MSARRRGEPHGLHLGVADHLGWAVVVAVADDASVVDRRRIEMVGSGLPAAPIHHLGGAHAMHGPAEPLSDAELLAAVAEVRGSATRTIGDELARLATDLPGPVATVSLRDWPDDFPTDIATQRQVPHESRADPVMYRTVLAEAARDRGWDVRTFTAKTIEADALRVLGVDDDRILHQPRTTLGPPWAKDHRQAFAAAIVASRPT